MKKVKFLLVLLTLFFTSISLFAQTMGDNSSTEFQDGTITVNVKSNTATEAIVELAIFMPNGLSVVGALETKIANLLIQQYYNSGGVDFDGNIQLSGLIITVTTNTGESARKEFDHFVSNVLFDFTQLKEKENYLE